MLKKSLTLEGGKCGVFSNGKRRISSIIEPPPARLEHSALDHGRLCEEKKIIGGLGFVDQCGKVEIVNID
jgi:hypothetical protein